MCRLLFPLYTITFGLSVWSISVCVCVPKSTIQKAKFQLSSTEVLVFEHDNSRLFRQTDWRMLFSLIHESISDLDDVKHNQCNFECVFIPVAYAYDCHQYIFFSYISNILLQTWNTVVIIFKCKSSNSFQVYNGPRTKYCSTTFQGTLFCALYHEFLTHLSLWYSDIINKKSIHSNKLYCDCRQMFCCFKCAFLCV